MKNIIAFFTLAFYISKSFSQVGINTTNPTGALDINSSTSGLVIPRIALSSKIVADPVTNPQGGALSNGTVIYNTATAGTVPNNVSPGFYFWDSSCSKWSRVNNNTISDSNTYSSPVIEPNTLITGSAGTCLTTSIAGVNTAAQTFDQTTVTKTINLSGYTGNICTITCNVQFNHTWATDVDLYLQSPTGQIIELSTDNGGFNPTTFNVIFSDGGTTNITAWTTGGNVNATFKPEGSLFPDVIAPNITTMSGFHGNSPNGTWTLILRDDAIFDSFNYVSFNLVIATQVPPTPVSYRLVKEIAVNYQEGSSIILNSNYSANSLDNEGVITALTRTTASVGNSGTLITNLSASTLTKLSYGCDSPRQGLGNYWVSIYNQGISSGLTNDTTYYFQLWVKGNIETPIASNEQWSLIPIQVQN